VKIHHLKRYDRYMTVKPKVAELNPESAPYSLAVVGFVVTWGGFPGKD